MIIDSIHERLKRSIYKLEEILIELEPMENLKDILIIKVLEIIFKETNQKSFLMKILSLCVLRLKCSLGCAGDIVVRIDAAKIPH